MCQLVYGNSLLLSKTYYFPRALSSKLPVSRAWVLPLYFITFTFSHPRSSGSPTQLSAWACSFSPIHLAVHNYANYASKTLPFSHSVVRWGYFGLLHGLYGPQLVGFDRGLHRSMSDGMATSSGCF